MDKGRLTTLISDLGLILVAIATLLGIRLDPNLATAIVSAVILIIIALLDIYHPEYKDLIDIDDSEELEKSSPTFKDHLDLNNRVTKLESENKTLFNEIREIKDALGENTDALNNLNSTLNEERVNNTKAINELTTLLHEEKLRVELMNEKESTELGIRSTIYTGVIVGVALLIVEGLLRIL